MRISFKSIAVLTLSAIFAATVGVLPSAYAEGSNEVHNIRQYQYNPSDTEHVLPQNQIVSMPIRTAATVGAATPAPITYRSGAPVMNNPTVYVIWYGTWSSPCAASGDNSTPAVVDDFLKGVGVTPWYGINTRYYQIIGGVKTFVTNTVNWGGCTYDNASLGKSLDAGGASTGSVVDAALTRGAFSVDPNGLYFVLTSSDVTVSGFGTSFCGYHSYMNPAASPSQTIKYSFVGDASNYLGGCAAQSAQSPNSNPAADGMASVIGHELVEAVSDPVLNAWYDAAGNENADKCAWTFGTLSTAGNGSQFNMSASGRQYLIQQNWIPDAPQGCAMSYSAPALTATTATATLTLNQGTAVPGTAIPVTATGGTAPYTYAISPNLPAGLSFNTATGRITGTATVSQASTVQTVTVTDSLNATSHSSFNLIVNPPAPTATRAVASVALLTNRAMTPVTPVTASGGTAPYTFTITPALPTGLSINASTGQITGTPTAPLANRVQTVRVTDANSVFATATFNLSITTPAALTVTVAVATKKLMVGKVAASFIPVTTRGGYGSNVFTINPALPAGLSLNAATGAITGTASASISATSHSITVTDANGGTVSASFSLQVSPALVATATIPATTILHVAARPAITPFTPVTASGSAYTAYRYAISPALPSGMAFNTTTGAITGSTPAAASALKTYTVTVTDASAFATTATFTLTIS